MAATSLLAALTIALVFAVSPTHASPSKTAASFGTASLTLDGSEIVEFAGCRFDTLPPNAATIVAAYTEVDADGTVELTQFWSSNLSREIAPVVQAGSARATQRVAGGALVYDSSNNHTVLRGYERDAGTRAHFVFASWGAFGSCTLKVNGVEVETTPPGFGSRATFLYLDDFRSGASAATGFADAGAAQTWTHTANGYLFAFLAPEHGLAQIDGPNGERLTDDTIGVTDDDFDPAAGKRNDRVALAVAKPTAGSWTFSVSSASETWGPVLWIVELR